MLSPRSKTTIAIVVVSLVALLLVIGAAGSSRTACATCHRAIATSGDIAAHSDAPCYDCHLDQGAWSLPGHKTAELFRMYPAALVGRGVSGPAVLTSRERCLACHDEILERPTEGARVRIDHKACAPGPSCDPCHSRTAHGDEVRWDGEPVMEDCVTCHSEKGVSIECATCHLAEPTGEGLASNGPWQVTHGKNWEKTHGMGKLESCSTCHPQEKIGENGKVTPGFCAKCHGVEVPHPANFGGTHGDAAKRDLEACQTCHPSRRMCDDCHQTEMPHPSAFLTEHTTIAKNTSDGRCFRCHVETDCEDCHAFHIHPGASKGVPTPWTVTPESRRPTGGD